MTNDIKALVFFAAVLILVFDANLPSPLVSDRDLLRLTLVVALAALLPSPKEEDK